MKMILKSALATAAIVGVTAMFPVVASAAAVGVTIGVGVPAPVVVVASPYGPGYVSYDEQYYYDPIFVSGAWYHGPYRWKMRSGERVFLMNGRWHRNEWRRGEVMPTTIVFKNGGQFRGGRNEGFGDAERINVRFRRDNNAGHDGNDHQGAGHDGNDHQGAGHDGNDHQGADHDGNDNHDKNDGSHN